MRLLSLEGAPCRGLGQIQIMKKISQLRSIPFDRHFDVYLGSSWGAVLALCLAAGMPMEQIEGAFETSQKYLNSRTHRLLSPLFPRMCPKKVAEPFKEFFQEKTFGTLNKRVICHGYDYRFKQIVTFDSQNPKDKDLNVYDLILKLIFAPSVFKPKMDISIVDVSLASRNPLFYSLMQFYREWKSLNLEILHIGVGEKRQEGSKVRKLFEKGWLHWLFSKQIFEELESIGRCYQQYLSEMVKNSKLFPSFKITTFYPLIDGGLDFSFMGDLSLTPEQIRKEVDGWMETFPIDHLEF
jgi:patatin-like phospholipase/acyl hydrolase